VRERGVAERVDDAATEITALELLADPPALTSEALVVVTDAPPLTDAERACLDRTADTLVDRTIALLDSPRDDRGYPLLLAIARLAALDRTAAGGRLAVLDARPPDGGERISRTGRAADRDLAALEDFARRDFDDVRTRVLAGAALRERDF